VLAYPGCPGKEAVKWVSVYNGRFSDEPGLPVLSSPVLKKNHWGCDISTYHIF